SCTGDEVNRTAYRIALHVWRNSFRNLYKLDHFRRKDVQRRSSAARSIVRRTFRRWHSITVHQGRVPLHRRSAHTRIATLRSEEHTSELQSRENLVCR